MEITVFYLVLLQSEFKIIIFIEHFIVHKFEAEWKKLKIYKDKASMYGYYFL